jgi:hypothetical protein
MLDGLAFLQKARERGLDLRFAELVHQPMELVARSHGATVPAVAIPTGLATPGRARACPSRRRATSGLKPRSRAEQTTAAERSHENHFRAPTPEQLECAANAGSATPSPAKASISPTSSSPKSPRITLTAHAFSSFTLHLLVAHPLSPAQVAAPPGAYQLPAWAAPPG